MSNIFGEDRETQIVGGGYGGYGGGGFGGFGGCFSMIVLLVVVLWLLFRDGRGNDGNCNNYGGYGMPYPYPPYAPYPVGGGNCCSPLDCKIPMTPDMSNCEIDRDIWKVDADMLKCCCEEKELIISENAKTRDLINANLLAELKEKLCEKNSEVQALKTQAYTDAKFDGLYAKMACYEKGNDMQYYKLDNKIDALICETPKRAPFYACGTTPNVHNIDCHDFPRRGKFNDCDCGCGC